MTNEEYEKQRYKLNKYSVLSDEIDSLTKIIKNVQGDEVLYISNVRVPAESSEFITLALVTASKQRIHDIKQEMEEL